MSCCDNTKNFAKLEKVLNKYKNEKGSLITILQNAQEIYGYLPQDVLKYIAKETKIPTPQVLGVATFYTQFRFRPIGKYLIMFCQGTACHVNGANKILDAISKELGIEDGQTTNDGMFTIKTVACLGCCSLSPVMMINEETYGNLTTDSAVRIIAELRGEQK
ncbi:MAG TPA: NADH-quinone oxidoreductase subunit NuoE [Clostridia bacterium]|nr:NADH-quinone oxidoreductase subunit NuoE [Clostridia bacterium]